MGCDLKLSILSSSYLKKFNVNVQFHGSYGFYGPFYAKHSDVVVMFDAIKIGTAFYTSF